MAKPQTSIPKGTRDFLPEQVIKRNYIFDTIKSVFQKFGFLPIETPAMENLSVLMGKYGDEGDKLLFKIINSGDYLKKVSPEELAEAKSEKLLRKVSEKGLRYDLTVPFARFVVQNRNEIAFPFKRYQIQPVWRADRPQKGRYREFFQCDADVIGSNSLLNEYEIVQMIDEVFQKLNLEVTVKINNRKLLAGIAETIGFPEKIIDITVAIDKLEKIGLAKVLDELALKGISGDAAEKLTPILNFTGSYDEKIGILKSFLKDSEVGNSGIAEIEKLFTYIQSTNQKCAVELDLTLARGLNYYTGAIFEVVSNETPMGSICGGGRYDNLTEVFGLKDISGVGISFGADRIYDVIEKLERFPSSSADSTKVLFTNFGEKEEAFCLPLLRNLREAGINAEIFPDSVKMKKQMTYANKKNVAYVVIVGEDEINAGKVSLKTMETGEQKLIDASEILNNI